MRQIVYRLFVDDGGHSAVFSYEQQACEEAEFYLVLNPDAIVMLVQLEMDRCKHCGELILEKGGWILHKWIHLHSAHHLCRFRHTQAEPEGTLL